MQSFERSKKLWFYHHNVYAIDEKSTIRVHIDKKFKKINEQQISIRILATQLHAVHKNFQYYRRRTHQDLTNKIKRKERFCNRNTFKQSFKMSDDNGLNS